MHPSSRLGPRLNAIFELVVDVQQKRPYTFIWDCCCDHGYLGIKILSENLCDKLIFVDQLPHLIEQLTHKLEPFVTGKHQLIAAPAGDLNFELQQRHLVIIAGVGAETVVQIMQDIECRHENVDIDYILCPSTIKNILREYLFKERFGLLFEQLVCENKRYYEIILVRGNALNSELPIVSESCEMWDENNADHQRYLKKINTARVSKKPKWKRVKIKSDSS